MKSFKVIGLIALGVLISSEVKDHSNVEDDSQSQMVENVLLGEEGQRVLEEDDRYKTPENTVRKDPAKKVGGVLMTRFFKRP